MDTTVFKRGSTLFLKTALVAIGVAVLALSVMLFPHVWPGFGGREAPVFARLVYLGVGAVYVTIVPFLIALFQAFLLLRNIDRNNAFSESSAKALGVILFSGVAMSVLYAAAMPLVFVIAELDDAPGLVLMWAAITCAPLLVATFAAVLRKLVQSAIDLKNDSELTI